MGTELKAKLGIHFTCPLVQDVSSKARSWIQFSSAHASRLLLVPLLPGASKPIPEVEEDSRRHNTALPPLYHENLALYWKGVESWRETTSLFWSSGPCWILILINSELEAQEFVVSVVILNYPLNHGMSSGRWRGLTSSQHHLTITCTIQSRHSQPR